MADEGGHNRTCNARFCTTGCTTVCSMPLSYSFLKVWLPTLDTFRTYLTSNGTRPLIEPIIYENKIPMESIT